MPVVVMAMVVVAVVVMAVVMMTMVAVMAMTAAMTAAVATTMTAAVPGRRATYGGEGRNRQHDGSGSGGKDGTLHFNFSWGFSRATIALVCDLLVP